MSHLSRTAWVERCAQIVERRLLTLRWECVRVTAAILPANGDLAIGVVPVLFTIDSIYPAVSWQLQIPEVELRVEFARGGFHRIFDRIWDSGLGDLERKGRKQ